jgi:hypothetical protein
VTYADTKAIANGTPIWANMRIAVSAGIMPLSPVQISSDARGRLLLWLNAGAPPRTASDTCTNPPPIGVEGFDAGVDSNAEAVADDGGGGDAGDVDSDDADDAESAIDGDGVQEGGTEAASAPNN